MKKKLFFYSSLITYTALVGVLFYFTFIVKEPSLKRIIPSLTDETSQSARLPEKCQERSTIEFFYYAHDYPTWEPNNKFGLYIYAENESYFELAQNLVNSSGGDWGYVLIPYNMNDRDYAKWSRVFDQLRTKHLIPVIQLWDVDRSKYVKQTRDAAKFLNSFLWPIKYRYISVYNEPNDQNFWYGEVDPVEYARILDYTIDVFKVENSDFFMMNGAFNTSAPTNDAHMDAFEYMRRMNEEVPRIFTKLDGWASHPYPQPNFSGNPSDKGRWSIRAYENELEYLTNSLGVKKNLPVFITETGWAHSGGESFNNSYLSDETVGKYFEEAYENVWLKDDRVRAVMPFTIRYEPPFDHFSWINKDGVPYVQFEYVKKIDKVQGTPPVIKSDEFVMSGC